MKFKNHQIRKALRICVVLAGGLALSAALSMTGSAQAAVHAAAGVAPAATPNCSRVIDYHNGSPLFSFAPGNGNYNLYFDNSGSATQFCKSIDSNGYVQLYDINGSEMCLALDAAAGIIHEATATACANRASYTEWLPAAVETGPPDPPTGSSMSSSTNIRCLTAISTACTKTLNVPRSMPTALTATNSNG